MAGSVVGCVAGCAPGCVAGGGSGCAPAGPPVYRLLSKSAVFLATPRQREYRTAAISGAHKRSVNDRSV